MMSLFRIVILLFFAQVTNATNYALIAGGSGSDFEMENFFVSDFNTYKKNLEERNWKVSTLFDRDARKVPGSKSATNKNIDEGIKAIISKLKTGDQFLLTFHSHGMKSDAKIPSHHSIVSEDVDGYSLQKLDAYADEAKRKGATIAVVDLSCYGSSQLMVEC